MWWDGEGTKLEGGKMVMNRYALLFLLSGLDGLTGWLAGWMDALLEVSFFFPSCSPEQLINRLTGCIELDGMRRDEIDTTEVKS